MKVSKYSGVFSLIDKALFVKIPFEIVHFPSSGVSSAMNQYAEFSKKDPDFPVKCLVIDLRISQFNKGPEENRELFYRFIKSQMEQYLDFPMGSNKEENIYKSIHNVINIFLQKKKKVLVIFSVTTPVLLDEYPDYRDLLSFIDHLRSGTNGNVNFIIISTCPQFSDNNPPPFSIISKYYNYFDKGKLYKTINEEILNTSGFKKHKPEDVLKLIEMTGGLVAIVKSIIRDLILQDKKLNEIYKFKFNESFFKEYQCTKFELERIKQRIKPEYITAILNLVDGQDVSMTNPQSFEYLSRSSILDENNKFRSVILADYLKLFPTPIKTNFSMMPQFLDYNVKNVVSESAPAAIDLCIINKNLKINKSTGEILIIDIPQDKYLTEKELEVFGLLYENVNKEVSREQISKILWNNSTEYSDWAIDKTISRIRDKIEDEKPYKVIKTLRNKGFMLIK